MSPDEGARSKAKFLADILGGIKYGSFDKRRDYTKIEDGKNPIIYHEFIGPERLDEYDTIIIDDIIASGTSLLDAAKQIKQRGAKKIYLMTTFSLFTNGIEQFEKAYQDKTFAKLYSTNLTYVPMEYQNRPWFQIVDCSKRIAQLINHLHDGKSIQAILNGKEETAKKIKVLKK